MSGQKPIAAAVAAAGGLLATVVLIPTVLLGGGGGGTAIASVSQKAAATGGQCTYTPKKLGAGTAAGIRLSLSASQLHVAGTAVGVAKQRKLPTQASIDVIVAGMQESSLTNLDHGDRDSVGFLQQRPSQGWGTVTQIMDPAYAAGKFFDHLINVAGWAKLPPARPSRLCRSPAPQTPTTSGCRWPPISLRRCSATRQWR